jgi:hypothetical protein
MASREIGYGQLRSTSHGSQKGSRPNGEPCSHDEPTMNRLNCRDVDISTKMILGWLSLEL